jgi:hypothetical protein
VRRSIVTSKSRITISFDGWKSGNQLDMLGIVAHYIDKDYKVKNVLLALRNTHGSHLGEELSQHLKDVFKEYGISDKVSFCMADNASNNDNALDRLAPDIPIRPLRGRLRCVAHIINLVCMAILYGTDIDCIEEVLEAALSNSDDCQEERIKQFEKIIRSQAQDEQATLKAWRNKGPVGKVHNIVLHARASPSRRKAFKRAQSDAYEDIEWLYELIINGGIKWNSTCNMLERAVRLREAIEIYCAIYHDDLVDDILTADDWSEITELLELLLPLRECSIAVQASGKDLIHGSLFESLQAMDFLLTKLEELKQRHQYKEDTHIKASINLGWKKLNKYYELTDKTPAYRAAIAIHPHFKLRWFKEHWKQHPEWIPAAKKAIEELYNQYKERYSDEATAIDHRRLQDDKLTEFERYNRLVDDQLTDDELERYLSEPREAADINPLTWWQLNQQRYPVLKHMAFDLLAAPASSSADERTFSKAGHILDKDHWHTRDDLAEAEQCLRSAYAEGIDLGAIDGDGGDDEVFLVD